MAQCTTCDDLLCAPCYYAHLRSKPSKSHKVKILVDDIPASYNKRKGTQTEKPKMRPNTAKALSSNVKCKRYMGINLSQFKLFMNGLKGKFYKSYKLAPEDQLCLFFNKVKTNACNTTLCINFDVDDQTVSTIFSHMVDIMYDFTTQYLYWPSRREVDETMPKSFRYGSTI